MKLFSNEIVFKGHPDKVCDQIGDTLLDAYLKEDKYSRTGIEVTGGKGIIFVTGEVSSKAIVDVENVVKSVLKDVGYNPDNYKVIDNLGKQSDDIALGVNKGGAGDQGMMFGYACDDTEEKLPLAQVILQELSKQYSKLCIYYDDFLPDGKAQITGYYNEDFKLTKIKTFTISYQNKEEVREFTDNVLLDFVRLILNKYDIEVEEYLINPTGKFLIGGFEGDAGVLGRKIVVDAYQSFANVGGGAFCVDNETEYLTKEGWFKISEYKEGTNIAQWDSGKLEFVKPFAYIETKADKMYKFENPNSLNMVLSENHDIVLESSKGNILKKQVKELLDANGVIKNGNAGSIPCYFEYTSDNIGVDISETDLRLQIAFCADGTILHNNSNWSGRISVKKEEKKKRLHYLLSESGKDYKVTETDDGFSRFYFSPNILSKRLKECFNTASNEQYKIIADEVFKWDGCIEKRVFRTTHKDEADFIQFILMAVSGKTVSILVDDRVGEVYGAGYIRKSICYEVCLLNHTKTGLRHNISKTSKTRLNVTPYKPLDGKMYCFIVPSGMLVLRRGNKVFITGNSGKEGTKVDRSGAYKARQIAKRMLQQHNLKWCEVQLSYAIGKAEPLAIYIDSDIGNIEPTDELYKECKPLTIIHDLDLRQPIYSKTAKYGHFGDKNFTWEKV